MSIVTKMTQSIPFKQGILTKSVLKATEKQKQYSFDSIDDYIAIPEITFNGDFEIELTCTKDQDSTLMSLGWTGSAETWGFYNYETSKRIIVRFAQDGTVPISLNPETGFYPAIGEVVKYKVVRIGRVSTFYANNQLQASVDTVVGSVKIDRIGVRGSNTNHWNGIIKNVSLKDLDIPNNSRFYAIDDGFENNPVIKDSLNPSGTTDGTAINFNEENWG